MGQEVFATYWIISATVCVCVHVHVACTVS